MLVLKAAAALEKSQRAHDRVQADAEQRISQLTTSLESKDAELVASRKACDYGARIIEDHEDKEDELEKTVADLRKQLDDWPGCLVASAWLWI